MGLFNPAQQSGDWFNIFSQPPTDLSGQQLPPGVPNYGGMSIAGDGDGSEASKPGRGGLFGRLRSDPAFGDRVRAAIAMMQGDQSAAARFQQLQIERQRLAAQQAEQQRAVQQRDDQIWGAKESGVGNPLIAAMTPGDLSQTLRERFTPYTGSPGSRHVMPSLNGGADTVDATPTTDQQMVDYLRQQDPSGRLATSYLAKQAVIMNQGVDPSTGQPFAQALDPQSLFPGLTIGGAPQAPQTGAAPPPQLPSADTRPANEEAPAFNADPTALAAAPPVTSYRGVDFGPPLANMPNLRNAPRRGAPRRSPAGGIVNVNSPQEAARLPRGTRFRTPDGRVIVRQ